jgi:hypothetical protein
MTEAATMEASLLWLTYVEVRLETNSLVDWSQTTFSNSTMATSWPGFEIATVIASDTCLVFIYTDYYYLVHLNPKEIEEE